MSTAEQTKEQTEFGQSKERALFRGPFDTIAKALVAAQLNARAVEKDAKNAHHGYKYASSEAVIEEARYALNVSGLATIMKRWELLAPLPGCDLQRVKIYFETVHDGSADVLTGDVEYNVIPDKGRPEDKATATALTYAESYYLRGLLCLPRVDAETDVDQRNDKNYDPNRRRQEHRGAQQRGSQHGNGQDRSQAQQQRQTSPKGNGQNKSADSGTDKTQSNAPSQASGKAPAKDRKEFWEARIVQCVDVAQLRTGITAGMKKDEGLTDEQRTYLIDLAERRAKTREEALESAGAPGG